MTLLVEVPGEKVMTVEPFQCSKQYSAELKKSDSILSVNIKEFVKELWAFRTKITVEPFVICYVLPSVLAGLAVQNLCFEKACIVNLEFDEQTCRDITQGRTQNHTQEEILIQQIVTKMTSWSFPFQTALPGILALFLGAWSDRMGNRKTFMMMPILGKLISAIGIIFSAVYFVKVGVNETALLEGLPPALAGGRVAMTMAVYSYITDITTPSERTFRIGIITAILTLSRPVGLALSGIMTNRFGYISVFVVACMFYLFGFVYIVVRLKEKKTKGIDGGDRKSSLLSVFSMQDLVATVNVAFKPRQNSQRLQIILIMFTHMLIVGPVLGEAQLTNWFTRYKFKFTDVDYSMFLTYSVLVGTVGSMSTIYLFSKRWKMHDTVIGVVACLSRIAAAILYALAPTRTIYFFGPVLDMFSHASATCLRSIISKLVSAHEIGKTSSLISISEALIPVIYSPLYGYVYNSTLTTFPGAFYLISAALAVPAIVLLVILHFLHLNDVHENASTSEHKSKESEITRF